MQAMDETVTVWYHSGQGRQGGDGVNQGDAHEL